MNFFIDFDHTLYNTNLLTEKMLSTLAKYIKSQNSNDNNDIVSTLREKFKRGKNNIYDIYDLIKYFSKTYKYDEITATNEINKVIADGNQFLYKDSIPFLKYLRNEGHKIYILSYNESKLYFQTVKIAGSGLLKYVDGLITTLTLKGDIPLDFSNSIFIDDKPKDLMSIYKNHPLNIYRIRRKNDTYSNEEIKLDNENTIVEFNSLEDLKIQMDKKNNKKML